MSVKGSDRKGSRVRSFWLTAAIFVTGLGHALGQSGPLVGAAAFGDWHSDKPGLSRIIKPDDLPKPGATPSVANFPHVVSRVSDAVPQVPPGFKVELFAEGLTGPREMRVAPNGDIFVAETHAGRIRVLRAADGNSKPSINEIFASGLDQPFGIAFFPSGDNPQWVYVANTDSIVRFSYAVGDTKASRKPDIVAGLPSGGSHTTRNLVFTPDNKRMLVSVGSRTNDAEGIVTFELVRGGLSRTVSINVAVPNNTIFGCARLAANLYSCAAGEFGPEPSLGCDDNSITNQYCIYS
ncbi:MAG: hypothetical protein E8A46_06680 [Bradyrhizobium sp.]|nr:MAG: hypothetical protein E8A46_06680 [Bradyrhizobium sp.]